jgi:hypothetical protein
MELRRSLAMLVVLAAMGTSACATYRDQLARSQHAFEQNDHDRALAILRDLEPNMKRLTLPEQAEYAYLRGMSDYRIGYKPDARHWLAVAKAYEEHSPGVLPADWKARTNEALDQLNGVVYSQGMTALSTSRLESDAASKDAHETKDPETKATGPDKGAKQERGPRKGAPSETAPSPSSSSSVRSP